MLIKIFRYILLTEPRVIETKNSATNRLSNFFKGKYRKFQYFQKSYTWHFHSFVLLASFSTMRRSLHPTNHKQANSKLFHLPSYSDFAARAWIQTICSITLIFHATNKISSSLIPSVYVSKETFSISVTGFVKTACGWFLRNVPWWS